jgi:hypothetical protein
LKLVARRHDVVAITVRDDVESSVPNVGVVMLRDPETGQTIAVDTNRTELRQRYHGFILQERNAIRRVFRRNTVDEIEIGTTGSFVGPLLAFFRRRERKLGR